MLFDHFIRTDGTPKKNRENDFDFLNRSARVEMEKTRKFLAQLLDSYPSTEQDELVSRVQSGDDTLFQSAIFELLLYSILRRSGYQLTAHPVLENGSNARPDFLVKAADGSSFYLEAVLASEQIGTVDKSAEAIIGATLDTLSQSSHPNFVIGVESNGKPKTQPKAARLRKQILSWLDSLDADEVLLNANAHGLMHAPTFRWTHEDWHVTFRALPVSKHLRGKSSVLIGVLDQGGGVVNRHGPIKKAVKYKGNKYGKLDLPLLVAVNVSSFRLDRIDEMQALYGEEKFQFSSGDNSEQHGFTRASNGVWTSESGPTFTRISGVWLFDDLSPYTIGRRSQTIYFNPWALHRLPDDLKRFPHAIPSDGKVSWIEGENLGDILGLPKDWPI
ncbi:hypothetical protein [Schauerella aestuarii]|uniref:hypothetical protein n=1 Tax=Schauerella aestuarii TaxID=2511204 RepID=UPI0013715FF6|nr:hypothetical protein [Achromobacter aestuarii]MYZ45446.1 hypothetical protein [Achromobacter aestuarii]